MTTDPTDGYLACIEIVCAALDGLQEYGINEGHAAGLLVLHGLAMYSRDTTRAAVALLDDGRTLAAGALTRAVIEHAVLAQWLRDDPDGRGQLFLQQSVVEQDRWYDVVLAADIELGDAANEDRAQREGRPRNVAAEFDTVKNLFGDTAAGRQFYLTYRNLSRFVHPAATTFMRYTEKTPYGQHLSTRLNVDQDAEALTYYLAAAIVMAALPYLDSTGEPVGAAVLVSAQNNGVPTSMD